jgi:hypothetical protein
VLTVAIRALWIQNKTGADVDGEDDETEVLRGGHSNSSIVELYECSRVQHPRTVLAHPK